MRTTALTTNYKVVFLALFSLLGLSCFGQESQEMNSDVAGMRAWLDSVNKQMTGFFRQKNADALMEYYDARLTYYPEYKPAIFSTAALNLFFRDWFI